MESLAFVECKQKFKSQRPQSFARVRARWPSESAAAPMQRVALSHDYVIHGLRVHHRYIQDKRAFIVSCCSVYISIYMIM